MKKWHKSEHGVEMHEWNQNRHIGKVGVNTWAKLEQTHEQNQDRCKSKIRVEP